MIVRYFVIAIENRVTEGTIKEVPSWMELMFQSERTNKPRKTLTMCPRGEWQRHRVAKESKVAWRGRVSRCPWQRR